jgi:hypothetical protein
MLETECRTHVIETSIEAILRSSHVVFANNKRFEKSYIKGGIRSKVPRHRKGEETKKW